MKEQIRALNLCKLSDTPLSKELEDLDKLIEHIQKILNMLEVKTLDVYPNDLFYFYKTKGLFYYSSDLIFVNYNDIYPYLKTFCLNIEITNIIDYLAFNHFKVEICKTSTLNESFIRRNIVSFKSKY